MNISILFRYVREALDISQKELADKLRVTQSAIAQFESLQAALSIEKILEVAPILNLNPEYIEKGVGNPFKQSDRQEPIRMFFKEDLLGKIDFSLVELIAESNHGAVFLFLKPDISSYLAKDHEIKAVNEDDIRQITKWLMEGCPIHSLLIRDNNGNTFLFRRRNNAFFSEKEISAKLKRINARENKRFVIKVSKISYPQYEHIRQSNKIPDYMIDKLYKIKEKRDDRDFLLRLAKKIWTHKSVTINERDYEEIKYRISVLNPQDVDYLLRKIMPEIAEVIRKYIRH